VNLIFENLEKNPKRTVRESFQNEMRNMSKQWKSKNGTKEKIKIK